MKCMEFNLFFSPTLPAYWVTDYEALKYKVILEQVHAWQVRRSNITFISALGNVLEIFGTIRMDTHRKLHRAAIVAASTVLVGSSREQCEVCRTPWCHLPCLH